MILEILSENGRMKLLKLMRQNPQERRPTRLLELLEFQITQSSCGFTVTEWRFFNHKISLGEYRHQLQRAL